MGRGYLFASAQIVKSVNVFPATVHGPSTHLLSQTCFLKI